MSREARIAVYGLDLVLEVGIPPDPEVRQYVGKLRENRMRRARYPLETEHRRDQHRAFHALALLGEQAGQGSAQRQPSHGQPLAQSRPGLRGAVGQCDQLLGAQLCDRRRQPIRVTVPWIPGDEHVPAQPVEMPAERIELLRAIRKPMKKDEGALGAMAVGVQARMTRDVDVGPVEVLEALGDLNSSFVRIAAHSRTGY